MFILKYVLFAFSYSNFNFHPQKLTYKNQYIARKIDINQNRLHFFSYVKKHFTTIIYNIKYTTKLKLTFNLLYYRALVDKQQ